jgi:hypothetical protein
MHNSTDRTFLAFSHFFGLELNDDPDVRTSHGTILVMRKGTKARFVGSDGMVLATLSEPVAIRPGRYRLENGIGQRLPEAHPVIGGFDDFLEQHDEMKMRLVGLIDAVQLKEFFEYSPNAGLNNLCSIKVGRRIEISIPSIDENIRQTIGKTIQVCDPFKIGWEQIRKISGFFQALEVSMIALYVKTVPEAGQVSQPIFLFSAQSDTGAEIRVLTGSLVDQTISQEGG